MSYRTLKRVLGETNFEVKCLVLFGFGLSVLAVLTFALYWWQTSSLIGEQNKTTARLLMAPMIQQRHWEWFAQLKANFNEAENPENNGEPDFVPDSAQDEELTPDDVPDQELNFAFDVLRRVEKLSSELQPEHLREFKFEMVDANPAVADPANRPSDDIGYRALQELRNGVEEFVHIDRDSNEYRYYGAVTASETCIACHHHKNRQTADGAVAIAKGDLIGMARITLPLAAVESSLHATNAFVITAEIVKVVLAILAIYLVVRYVITKPVLHLKKVSDAIAHGNLDMRADIRTGDEFEELSHAFNRMLRHLVTVQEELREVNADLDGKVDELASVNLQLYEMNNVKNEFLATMSHELRTPLNSILGFSEVLADSKNLTDKEQRYASNIQTSGRSLMTLINDVLDLAKIESGKMELHPAEFRMNDLVERQVSTLMPLAEKRQIALTWAVDAGMPTLFQDPGKMQQILTNLISNAIKFTPEGGRVRIFASRIDEKCVVTIEDNGIGIPLDEQERIFEKFRQGRGVPGQTDALTRKYEGTGLGLSIVKELSRLLDGEVYLESEFGKGSKFTVELPLILKDSNVFDEEATSRLVGLNRFRTADLPAPDARSDASTAVRSTEKPQDEAASKQSESAPGLRIVTPATSISPRNRKNE
ncbi:MAG: HAMP domain-containing protein [Planctomycetaceae bacterium]|jgi:two-component system sensor histidine kinase BarA|nr:HAMP domain-containing protein [Planctomycetaceae bacterium]